MSDVSINCVVATLKALFRFLAEDQVPVINPAPALRRIKEPERDIETISYEEFQALCDQIDVSTFLGLRDTWILMVLYDTGLRVSELCRLRLGDIDSSAQMFRVVQGKGRKDRRVPFGNEVKRATEIYLEYRQQISPPLTHDCVLTTREGRPFTSFEKDRNGPSRILHMIREYAKAAGITRSIHPHLFRHTFAVQYLRANPGDIYRLKVILGHSTLMMVNRYLRFVERDLQLGHRTASPMDHLRKKQA